MNQFSNNRIYVYYSRCDILYIYLLSSAWWPFFFLPPLDVDPSIQSILSYIYSLQTLKTGHIWMRKSNEQSKRSRYDDKSAEFRGFHAVHVLPAHTYARTRIAGQHTTSFLEKNAQPQKKGEKKNQPTRRGQGWDDGRPHWRALWITHTAWRHAKFNNERPWIKPIIAPSLRPPHHRFPSAGYFIWSFLLHSCTYSSKSFASCVSPNNGA